MHTLKKSSLTFQVEITGTFIVISVVRFQRRFEPKFRVVEKLGPVKGPGRGLKLAMQKIGTKHVGSAIRRLFFV